MEVVIILASVCGYQANSGCIHNMGNTRPLGEDLHLGRLACYKTHISQARCR